MTNMNNSARRSRMLFPKGKESGHQMNGESAAASAERGVRHSKGTWYWPTSLGSQCTSR